MFVGFQYPAFQGAAGSSEPILLGGGPGEREDYVYNPDAFKHAPENYLRKKLAREQAELEKINAQIAEAERLKQEKLSALEAKSQAENAAIEMAALEATLQEEINMLRIQRAWLMRFIDDEEAILAILLAMPVLH